MTFPSEHDFALFLFQLFVLLSVALTLGSFLRRLGQAAVVGEIVAGVLLGPSVLGALGAYLGGMPRPEALAVGFGLNARGAMEIILAFLALEYSLINERSLWRWSSRPSSPL